MRIGVDLMGSDNSPFVLFEAVLEAREFLDPSSCFTVIATHSVVKELKSRHADLPFIEFHPVSDTITMGDEPVKAVSRKIGSSIVVGMRLLKKNYLDAFVSAGNTGALVASATLQLPRLGDIKRPALLALLPTGKGAVAILDIGGNVSCKAHHLVQFAYMGAAFQKCNLGIESPRVGLLNIGLEPKKGTSAVREAYQILTECMHSDHPLNFVGNVEGRDLFKGVVDVLVTDGFTGNVLLKTSEGISAFIFEYLQESFEDSQLEQLKSSLVDLKKYFSYAEHPGAILCGVEGIVMKCHGHASAKALKNSIKGAIHLVRQQFISKIKAALAGPTGLTRLAGQASLEKRG